MFALCLSFALPSKKFDMDNPWEPFRQSSKTINTTNISLCALLRAGKTIAAIRSCGRQNSNSIQHLSLLYFSKNPYSFVVCLFSTAPKSIQSCHIRDFLPEPENPSHKLRHLYVMCAARRTNKLYRKTDRRNLAWLYSTQLCPIFQKSPPILNMFVLRSI